VRPTPDARVSAPLFWNEIADCDPRDFTMRTMITRFATVGDRHSEVDRHAGSLDALLELSARQERDGHGDAPWPPHYRKQAGEAPRVAPSKRRATAHPLLEIARSRDKAAALAGVDRWKARHPEAAAHLKPADVLVDAMRGRFRTWTRVRINLQHVPDDVRPAQEPLDPDDDVNDWNVNREDGPRRRPSRARKES
jgi:bifunctional non-homologous end joining protein LigD